MSANTNNSNNTSSHHPPITSKNDGNGKIVHQKGATNVAAATTATNTTAITTATSHHQVPFDNTENGDKHNTHNTNSDDALNGTATILLDELDDEILHAEEADLMLKHYKQLQEKVRWETRGQHNEQFYDMINSTSSNTISRGSAKTGKGVSRNARQREPPAKRTKKHQETSKSSHASAVIFDDGNTPKYGTESILLLAKSRRRGRDRITTSSGGSSNHTIPNPSQPRRRRPRLQLMDPNTESTMTTTSGRNTAVLHDSIEIIHDLQLIRATTLLPRMFTNSTTNNHKSTNSTDHEVIRTEWKKKELERFLYTKFVKSCIGHCRIYCMYHHPLDGDMSKNIYWKHFRIQLQSANANSWRCIVIGYRAMVNDVLLFLRQLKLIGQQNHHRNVDDNTSITATTSSAASSTA